MRRIAGRNHWHAEHAASNPSEPQLARWARAFDEAAPSFAEAGVEVINCTPASAITAFRFMDLVDALRR
jgi:hypothetical protein